MPYTIQLDTALEATLDKLKKKDNSLYQRVIRKIIEISKNPELGKPLRNVLKGKRRVHVGSFVLFYSIDKKNEVVLSLGLNITIKRIDSMLSNRLSSRPPSFLAETR